MNWDRIRAQKRSLDEAPEELERFFVEGGFSSGFDRLAVGLPLITIPASKLEPGRVRPALGLTEAERRADQALAARSLLELVAGSRAMSVV